MAYTLATSNNSANDLYLNPLTGNIATFRDLQAVLQACEHAAKTLLGEMILNTDQGIPYFQNVWNGNPNVAQFEAALRAAFLAVTNVIEVVSIIASVVSPNILRYTAVIKTSFGGGAISG